MQTYDDKPIDEINWTKYKIIVPTEHDKKELEEAFEHLHYTECDTNFVAVNQLIHEYLTPERSGNPRTQNNIIVNKNLYNAISVDAAKERLLELYENQIMDLTMMSKIELGDDVIQEIQRLKGIINE